MNCNQCGRILDYVDGDCYACPVHGYDWMKNKNDKGKGVGKIDD